ncbi:MAG: HD-GYP domain-containing protein [Actinobacteria bacterium HGW-Actinobacteria-10]|nr:MAG: HD-GYP domain-containing protein [Actinobacteria bacterium HGW-Actinobacteria-10]
MQLTEANQELARAYDETILGWAHALDMRDQATHGHAERVTDLTLRLAQRLGLGDGNLADIRRGAFLHDIGKMTVPDSILNKAGPLTEEEWEIMRGHPLRAHALLSRIDYLKGAIDIPYCHHERWDGSGYPQGLRGEDIPLAARVFAVVDVWDALTSDRPYRAAWSEEKAMDYLLEQAGMQFDPIIVAAFIQVLRQGRGSVLSL